MANVKTGDMAKVVAPHANAGLVVEVLAPMTETDRIMLLDHSSDFRDGMVVWRCKIFGGGMALRPTEGRKEYVYPGFESLLWDAYLRRIEPGAPDETIDKTVENEVAA